MSNPTDATTPTTPSTLSAGAAPSITPFALDSTEPADFSVDEPLPRSASSAIDEPKRVKRDTLGASSGHAPPGSCGASGMAWDEFHSPWHFVQTGFVSSDIFVPVPPGPFSV